jgi:hypothetical protein
VNSTVLYVVPLVGSNGFSLVAGLELDSFLVVSVTELDEMVETKLVTGALVD